MLKLIKVKYIFIFVFVFTLQLNPRNSKFLLSARSLEAASQRDLNLEHDLRDAVRQGDIEQIKKAIAQGVDVNTTFNFAAYNNMKNVRPTVLMYAAAQGNLQVMDLLLKAGADSTLKDNKNKTALHYAAWTGNIAAIEYLLNNSTLKDNNNYLEKAIIIAVAQKNNVSLLKQIQNPRQYLNSAVEFGLTPLMIAARRGNIEAIRAFIDLGSDLEVENRNGNTALNIASMSYRQNEGVRVLLQNGADPASQNNEGNSPLHSAAASRNSQIVKTLLDNYADPLVRNNKGQTPLIRASDYTHAVTHQSPVVARLLLRNNIQTLNLKDNEGNTALDLALKTKNFHMSNFLRQIDASPAQLQKAFSLAVEHNDSYYNKDLDQTETIKVVKEYIASGIDLNAVDECGWTALMRAVSTAQPHKVALFLKNGADPNIVNQEGTTALDTVGRYSAYQIEKETWQEIFLLLVNYGVNLKNISGEKEYTALNNAIEYDRDNLALLMIQKGIDVNTIVDRKTALDLAVRKGKIQIVKELLSREAKGKYALESAVKNKNYEIARLFADYGIVNYRSIAEIIRTNNYGLLEYFIERTNAATVVSERRETPLMMAAAMGRVEIVKLLLENGANPNVGEEFSHDSTLANKRLFASLMLAVESNNAEVVRLLLLNGANPNIEILKGQPLQKAIENNRIDIVIMLLEHGAEVTHKYGHERKTLLMEASFNGQLEIIDRLLNYGADINLANQLYYPSDTEGNFEGTPLMWAIAGGQDKAAKLLIKRGADVEKSLHLSIQKNRQDIYNKILELNQNGNLSSVESIN